MESLKHDIAKAVSKITRELEIKLGITISSATQQEVLEYCKRKLVCIKKDDNYLPLLYRCELPIYLNRTAITDYSIGVMRHRKESMENVQNLPTATLCFQMSKCF